MASLTYSPTTRGHMPVVEICLSLDGDVSFPIQFIVDSGAAVSTVPRNRVNYMHLPAGAEEDTGLRDANGRPIVAAPVEFEVILRGMDLPRVRERIWVMPAGDWGLLGQTWFEHFAVHFQNFPTTVEGRRFHVHPRAVVR
jgi:hypothetical protein